MSSRADTKNETPESVKEIRNAVRAIDERRRDASLEPKERELLELSAVTLRKAERVASAALEKQITSEMADAVKDIKKQSSLIRARVTRMGKVPKALDRIESVIGGIVSVLKEISRWPLCLTLILLLTASCSVLTKSQIKMAADLSLSADTATACPVVIFEHLEKVRRERGVLYSASLLSPQAHWDEVTSFSKQCIQNAGQVKKSEVYVKALKSYSNALGSLASSTRWQQYGTETRGIGRKVDSVFSYVNEIGLNGIDVGFAKIPGRYVGLLTEGFVRCRQAKLVKAFVMDGDTVVARCVNALVTILKSDAMKSLIENEKEGLKDDYRAYLDAASLTDDFMEISMKGDAVYMECDRLLNDASAIRTRCITALQSYSRAHTKMVQNFRKRSKTSSEELAKDIYDDIATLNMLSSQLSELIKKQK
ncbi:MAG: hypothetical protein KBS57_00775 [Alistipes sp.]|nr:hypothetical protein [Candidatus Minthomonas equi]